MPDFLGRYTNTNAKVHLKQNVVVTFRPKSNLPFSALYTINKILDRLGNMIAISILN